MKPILYDTLVGILLIGLSTSWCKGTINNPTKFNSGKLITQILNLCNFLNEITLFLISYNELSDS